MKTNYQTELIQVAAVQDDVRGTTALDGVMVFEQLAIEAYRERKRQVAKWGTRSCTKQKWFTILVEEVGEVVRDILENRGSHE